MEFPIGILECCFCLFCLVHDAPNQFRSYGAETGKMIGLTLGVINLKQHQLSKPHHLLELRDA
jgi:hypothetical protein